MRDRRVETDRCGQYFQADPQTANTVVLSDALVIRPCQTLLWRGIPEKKKKVGEGKGGELAPD